MSKGSKIVNLRVSDELHEAIIRDMESRNSRTREEPWNLSDWFRNAAKAKLSHSKRSRAKKRAASKLGYKPGIRCLP